MTIQYSPDELQEQLDQLREAQRKLQEGYEILSTIQIICEDRNAQSYIIPHLDNWINGVNPYDMTLDKIIEKVEELYIETCHTENTSTLSEEGGDNSDEDEE